MRFHAIPKICLLLVSLVIFHTAQGQEFQPALQASSVTPTIISPGSQVKLRFQFSNYGQPTEQKERVFVHFVPKDDKSEIEWQADHEPSLETYYWNTKENVQDGPLYSTVPENTPVGEYQIRVGLWNPENGQRSLDTFLEDPITVQEEAPSLQPVSIQPLDQEESQARWHQLQERFQQPSTIDLESKALGLKVNLKEGIFLLRNKKNQAVWQSFPKTPVAHAYVRQGTQFKRIALNQLRSHHVSSDSCTLRKTIDDHHYVDLKLQIHEDKPALTWNWNSSQELSLEKLVFEKLLWTTETLGGGLVVPRLEGQFFPADSGYEFRHAFHTYQGWGGLNMPMCGMISNHSSLTLSWNRPYTSIQSHSLINEEEKRQILSADLHVPKQEESFTMHLNQGDSYVDIAQTYRDQIKENEKFVPLKEQLKRNPELHKLLGAPEFKPFVLVRHRRENEKGEIQERVNNAYTDKDCLAIAHHLHEKLELEKALFVLAGWIHRGYDNQHPDILPAAEEIGGDEGVRAISKQVRSFDYLFGLHDNYQDMYEDAPSWDPEMILMNANQKRMKGGVWAGGQAWLIASNYGLEFAQRNLPDVKERYQPNAYFIDTTFAAPLYESHHPENPLAYADDLHYKQELFRYASSLFPITGSETGMEFGVPVCHYFEGILSGERMLDHFPNRGAYTIPFFPLVFHEYIVMLTHQGDRCGIGDATKILKHLATGTMPLYQIGPHKYWENEPGEFDLSQPKYTFARGNHYKHPMDCFIKNTYELLSPIAEKVALLPMTNHEYLTEDRTVERSQFGEHWIIVVNYGPEDYLHNQTLLPPMGFIVTGPDFLAQHFYPDARNEDTMMIIRNGDDNFVAFR